MIEHELQQTLTNAEEASTPERLDTVSYEHYRQFVDELSPAFRKVGIVDAAGFDRAVRDPRTVRLRLGENLELPLLTPIEHVAGYDIERSRELTGRNVLVMSLPLAALTGQDTEILPATPRDEDTSPAILVETDHAETADAKHILPDLLVGLGAYQPRDFLDQRIEDPELRPAYMGMYEARFVAVDDRGEVKPRRHSSFFEAYQELIAQGRGSEFTKLLDVNELRHDEALVDALWDLCKDRFEWLGEAHPVSMEDTQDFFLQIVLNEDTHALVRYDDEGRPACPGFFMSGLGECSWIKPKFRMERTLQAAERDDQILYFYGMASNSKNAAHYSRDVVQLLADIVNQMGGACNLLFESTNMSGQYIPKIVASYVEQSGGIQTVEAVHQTERIDYWYLSPATTD